MGIYLSIDGGIGYQEPHSVSVRYKKGKGGRSKTSHQPLPLVEPIPYYLRVEDGLFIISRVRASYYRDQEEKKMMRVHLDTSFNYLLDIKSVIGMETMDVEREDYMGTILGSIRMADNGAKKWVSVALQSKEGLEKLKVRASTKIANIKSKLSAVREVAEIVEHEQHRLAYLQIQLDDMWIDMIKIYLLSCTGVKGCTKHLFFVVAIFFQVCICRFLSG